METTMTQAVLQKYQKVYCALHAGRYGYIYGIEGEQRPETVQRIGPGMVTGGSAWFRIVFEDGSRSQVPESIVRGVQWKIYDDVQTEEYVRGLLVAADELEKRKAEEAKKEAEASRLYVEKIRRENKHLEQFPESTKSSHALGAANVRRELKLAFLGVSFSVRSRSFAGGDAIDIGWTDGPMTKEVEAITQKYQEGHFDGMNDIYNYTNSEWPSVFGGAKYVCENRSVSKERIEAVAKEMGFDDAEYLPNGEINGVTDYEMKRHIINEAYSRSYYVAPKKPSEPETTKPPVEDVEVRRNNEKGGIEIVFPTKPDTVTLETLKQHGFRWSRYQKLWWAKFTEDRWAVANALKGGK